MNGIKTIFGIKYIKWKNTLRPTITFIVVLLAHEWHWSQTFLWRSVNTFTWTMRIIFSIVNYSFPFLKHPFFLEQIKFLMNVIFFYVNRVKILKFAFTPFWSYWCVTRLENEDNLPSKSQTNEGVVHGKGNYCYSSVYNCIYVSFEYNSKRYTVADVSHISVIAKLSLNSTQLNFNFEAEKILFSDNTATHPPTQPGK